MVNLKPGTTFSHKGLRMTLVSQISPHSALLSSYFVFNGSYALLSDEEFQNSKLLLCDSYNAARDMKCDMPYDICQCQAAEKRLNCACKNSFFTNAYEKRAFPLLQPGIMLKNFQNKILAEMLQSSAVQVQVSFRDFTLENVVTKTLCYAKFLSAVGCYKCQSGMELALSCTSDHIGALAHISCQYGIDFFITCSPESETHTRRLYVSNAYIAANCSVTCSAGVTYFDFNTTLLYIPARVDSDWSSSAVGIAPPLDIDFAFLTSWLFADWKRTLGFFVIVAIAIAVPVTSFCGCGCCACLLAVRRLPKRRRYRQ